MQMSLDEAHLILNSKKEDALEVIEKVCLISYHDICPSWLYLLLSVSEIKCWQAELWNNIQSQWSTTRSSTIRQALSTNTSSNKTDTGIT
jgi:hypothetical protein